MPFPKSAQIKGGKAPATASQKAAAKAWMLEHHPWKRSTGRKTPKKAIAALNDEKSFFKRRVKSWECPNLEAYQAECDRTDQTIAQLKAIVTEQAKASSFVVKTQRSEGDRPWKSFTVKITLQHYESEADDQANLNEEIWINLRMILENHIN
jgi:hypothetical protein